jgi:hypothetical protein
LDTVAADEALHDDEGLGDGHVPSRRLSPMERVFVGAFKNMPLLDESDEGTIEDADFGGNTEDEEDELENEDWDGIRTAGGDDLPPDNETTEQGTVADAGGECCLRYL